MTDADVANLEVARRRRRRNNIIFSAGAAVAALVFGLFVIPAGVQVPAAVQHLPLSPRFFPYVLTGLVFVFALILLFSTLFGPSATSFDDEPSDLLPSWFRRLPVLAAVFVAYAYLPEEVGMLLIAIGATLALLLLAGERRLLILAQVGLIAPAAIYFFFAEVAQVPMPPDILVYWR